MNALNDLTTEVRFRERMRGYDFEEVDSYVKAVSRAVAQGRDQISELQQRLAHSESHGGHDDGVPETREMLLRTLVLAQRTADTAVSEARSEAKSISDSAQERAAKTVAEAEAAANARLLSSEERAAKTIAEAEENCQLILAEAKRTAAAELATERARKMEEIQALEATRARLEAATEAIEARLENERTQLRHLAISFQSFVEQFEPAPDAESVGEAADVVGPAQDGEVGEAPDLGAGEPASDPEALADPDALPESVLEFPPDSGEPRAAEEEDSEDEPRAAEEDAGHEPRATEGEDPEDEPRAAEEDPGHEPQALEHSEDSRAAEDALAGPLAASPLTADTVPDLPPVGWQEEYGEAAGDSPGGTYPTGPGGPGPAHPGPAEADRRDGSETVAAPAMHAGAGDGPELFDIEAEDDDEFIEQLRQVVSSDAPLPNSDAAMAAFFDHDEGRGGGAAGRGGRLGQRA